MRELWGHKLGLALALALATLAASRFLVSIGIVPPRIEGKSLGLASASTHVLVDTRRSATVDLREDTSSFKEMTNRALLLGNVMASLPVRELIARRLGVQISTIRVAPPLTVEQPRPLAGSSLKPKSSDIFKSPEEYRLSIEANPTVPILGVYSEAPNTALAVKLANGAVSGLRDYLDQLARLHSTPRGARAVLTQLGAAEGGPVASGASPKLAVLAFLLVFAVTSAAVLFVARVRRGWSTTGATGGGQPLRGSA